MSLRTISIDELDYFSIDTETHKLFWKGQEIVTALRLPWWVNVAVILAAISTFGLFIEGLVPFLK